MSLSVSPTQDQVNAAVGGFLQAILPSAVEIAVSQVNRVPEPKSADFVLLTPISRNRLVTNVDTFLDCRFVGAIVGTVLTVSSVAFGSIAAGAPLFGPGTAAGSKIVSQSSGSPGGTGTYVVSPSQTIVSETMAAGTKSLFESSEVDIQIDVHGPNSAENAQIISSAWRDSYACTFLAAVNPAVSPLDADDARQSPFINDQGQMETRYVLTARLQVNFTVSLIPQQFADALRVAGFIAADIEYPAA